MSYTITINGVDHKIDADPAMPLLWVIRDRIGLTGTKYGCGMGLCGACTVHVNGRVTRSCVLPISAADGASVTTIEGLSEDNSHPVQQAWIEMQVPQCGYCQPGMIMSVAGLLDGNPNPGDDEINQAITNICRCGTYPRIRRGIHRAAELAADRSTEQQR